MKVLGQSFNPIAVVFGAAVLLLVTLSALAAMRVKTREGNECCANYCWYNWACKDYNSPYADVCHTTCLQKCFKGTDKHGRPVCSGVGVAKAQEAEAAKAIADWVSGGKPVG